MVESLCFLYTTAEDRDHAQGVGGSGRGISALKKVGRELLYALRARRFSESSIACVSQPHGEEGDQSDDDGEDRGGCRNRASIPTDKLAYPVLPCVGPCLQGLAVQIMIDVADQSFHRLVPAAWILVHGVETEHIQISPGGLAQR